MAKRIRTADGAPRFVVERQEEDWLLADYQYGSGLQFESRRAAEEAATFAREYVRRHGDINFDSFPFSLTEELDHQQLQGLKDWHAGWANEGGA